jgi:hypothetical protein
VINVRLIVVDYNDWLIVVEDDDWYGCLGMIGMGGCY